MRDTTITPNATGHGSYITPLWSCNKLPADVSSTEDKGLLSTGLTNKGAMFRFVDFPPNSPGVQHRSITLDYGFVVKGELYLTLDDGSRTVIREGDTVVQQATMHGWANETDQWARLLCVLINAEAPVINGRQLETQVPFKV
jgi:quercetin dioxygenase-like cupin family protein